MLVHHFAAAFADVAASGADVAAVADLSVDGVVADATVAVAAVVAVVVLSLALQLEVELRWTSCDLSMTISTFVTLM